MLEASSRNRYSLTIADAPGQGVVTLSRDGNAVAEFAFTVAEGERMELDRFGAESATVRVGGDATFVASVFDVDDLRLATGDSFRWSSSDESILRFDDNNVGSINAARAQAVGTVEIIAETDSLSASFSLVVE